MSSTILYKFRSGTTFEALPLPGSAARLFDVKKAIVIAKKLDQGSMDFDLSVRDATTNEEYNDDAMLLPRGTRLIVKRLPVPPSAKGQGLLAKIARSQYYGISATNSAHPAATSVAGGPGSAASHNQKTGAPHDFYTIDGSVRDDDEEFVSSGTQFNDEEKELAALRAATDAAASASNTTSGGMGRGIRPNAGGFRPPIPGAGGPPPSRSGNQASQSSRYRPNADPELREQEKLMLPKKRTTGVPRTFLNLKAPPSTTGDGGAGEFGEGNGGDASANVPLLQPNTIGFEELVHRGGGQSENTSGTKRNLDYALKLTATAVPDYLQCAICHKIVKDAMILTWDPDGRTTCEKCIRDALTQNGFRCPLTGQEGVSPDDLIPNIALRKVADKFIKDLMAEMDEIEKSQVDDDIMDIDGAGKASSSGDILEGGDADKGVILSRRATVAEKKKKQEEDDPFGGGDDPFGGDVFAVEADRNEEKDDDLAGETSVGKDNEDTVSVAATGNSSPRDDQVAEGTLNDEMEKEVQESGRDAVEVEGSSESPQKFDDPGTEEGRSSTSPYEGSRNRNTDYHLNSSSRREPPQRRRGPPVGYTMGPAGGAVGGPKNADKISETDQQDQPSRDYHGNSNGASDRPVRGGRGGRFFDGGRGRGRARDSGRGGRFVEGGRSGGGRLSEGGRGSWPSEGSDRRIGGRFGDHPTGAPRDYRDQSYASTHDQREESGHSRTPRNEFAKDGGVRQSKRPRSDSDGRSDDAAHNDRYGRADRGGHGGGRVDGGRDRGRGRSGRSRDEYEGRGFGGGYPPRGGGYRSGRGRR